MVTRSSKMGLGPIAQFNIVSSVFFSARSSYSAHTSMHTHSAHITHAHKCTETHSADIGSMHAKYTA